MEEGDEAAGSFGSDLGAPFAEDDEVTEKVNGEEEGEEFVDVVFHLRWVLRIARVGDGAFNKVLWSVFCCVGKEKQNYNEQGGGGGPTVLFLKFSKKKRTPLGVGCC